LIHRKALSGTLPPLFRSTGGTELDRGGSENDPADRDFVS
jgi:hypothetical protein